MSLFMLYLENRAATLLSCWHIGAAGLQTFRRRVASAKTSQFTVNCVNCEETLIWQLSALIEAVAVPSDHSYCDDPGCGEAAELQRVTSLPTRTVVV